MIRGSRPLPLFVALLLALHAVPSLAQSADSTASAKPADEAPAAAEAEAPVGPRPRLRALLLPTGAESRFVLDGKLTEAEWASADSISDLTMFEPDVGGATFGRTVVRVLASPTGLVIGFRCDGDPAAIVSHSKARDVELDEEDHILFVIDSFGDDRSGFVFGVNPTGSRFDGIITAAGDDVNSSWDALWEAGVSQDARGWSGEIRLPVSSLTFKQGLTQWGLNVERRVQSRQESDRWHSANQDYEIYQMSRAGLLTDLPAFDLGIGLTIRPSVVGRYFVPDVGENREFESDASLDLTQKLGPNFTATATVNTDFAETEVDERQTNLTRFDVLFPEKRSFFLEGADIFEFGLGLDLEGASVLPFFSRRVGLFTPEGEDEGTTVPLNVGGKIVGRIGETNLGGLIVSTGEADVSAGDVEFTLPSTQMGALRLRQNVFSESSVGLIATSGDPQGRRSYTVGGDFTYRTSKFMTDKNLQMGVWALGMDRDTLSLGGIPDERGDDQTAYGGKIAYPNDLVDLEATYFHIGEDFSPTMGFVQRVGDIFYGAGKVSPRPKDSFIRQYNIGASYFQASKLDGGWESYNAILTPVDIQFESGDRIAALIEPQGERPEEPFDVFDSPELTVELLDGEYKFTRYAFTGTMAAQRPLSGEVTYGFGDFYGGTLNTVEANLLLKPHSMVSLRFTGERNEAKLPEGDFTQYLYGLRSELKPTPQLQLTNFVQYDNESRSLGSSSRLRWTFHPLGDLFVTFNQNLTRSFGEPKQSWVFLTDQLLAKLQYSFRL